MRTSWLTILGLSLLTACSGGDKEDDTEDTNTPTETETDTESGTDSDTEEVEAVDPELAAAVDDYDRTDYEYEFVVEGAAEFDTESGDLYGEIEYTYVEDGSTVCDSTIELVGTTYTGNCDDCDWAFGIEAEATREDGTSDCSYDFGLSFISDSTVYAEPSLMYWSEYYGGLYTDVVTTSFQYDLSDYGYGVYEGPYFAQIWDYYSTSYGTTPSYSYADVSDGSITFGYANGGTVMDYYAYYEYCDYVYWSYADTNYGGDDSLTGEVDCDGVFFDTFTFQAVAGTTAYVSIDTIADDSAFDPFMRIQDADGCTLVTADDNFDCTYTPAAYYCPSVGYDIEEDGEYTVVVGSYGSCNGDSAEYSISIDVE